MVWPILLSKEMFREDEMRDIRADEHQNRTGDLWGFEKINIKFLNFVLDTFDSALEQEERPSKQALNAEPVVMLDDGMLVTITCNKRTPFLPLDLLASQEKRTTQPVCFVIGDKADHSESPRLPVLCEPLAVHVASKVFIHLSVSVCQTGVSQAIRDHGTQVLNIFTSGRCLVIAVSCGS